RAGRLLVDERSAHAAHAAGIHLGARRHPARHRPRSLPRRELRVHVRPRGAPRRAPGDTRVPPLRRARRAAAAEPRAVHVDLPMVRPRERALPRTAGEAARQERNARAMKQPLAITRLGKDSLLYGTGQMLNRAVQVIVVAVLTRAFPP